MDWKNLCRDAFKNHKAKALIGVSLFKAVNESMDISEEGVITPAIIIKLIQIIYQENTLTSKVNEYIRKKSLVNFKEASEKRYETGLLKPVIATTNTEMSRLQAAWESSGIEHEVVAGRIKKADKAITSGLIFPSEGGQHIQWYQCDPCEVALSTINSHEHLSQVPHKVA